jgi:hypothetical protein
MTETASKSWSRTQTRKDSAAKSTRARVEEEKRPKKIACRRSDKSKIPKSNLKECVRLRSKIRGDGRFCGRPTAAKTGTLHLRWKN